MTLNSAAKLLKEEFEKRNYQITTFSNPDLLLVKKDDLYFYTHASKLPHQPAYVSNICANKNTTKEFLNYWNFPTPKSILIEKLEDINEKIHHLKSPYVFKPLDQQEGIGVVTNIKTKENLIELYIDSKFTNILVEEMIDNMIEARALVIDKKLFAFAIREAAILLGNGSDSIKILIEKENELRHKRAREHNMPRNGYPIKVDDELTEYLKQKKLSLDSIIERGRTIRVRPNINMVTGGITKDITTIVHPSVVDLCENIAVKLKSKMLGIDLFGINFEEAVNKRNITVLELNSAPGFGIHAYVREGEIRNPASTTIDSYLKN